MPRIYVALGDSMSIDLYPRLELQERGRVGAADAPGVGAAALFHRNVDALWPEFEGRDLVSRWPGMRRVDHCTDGATIGHTLDVQLGRVAPDVRAATALVTVTAGGNDLLGGLFDGVGGLERTTAVAVARYEELADRLLDAFPSATLLLTTVYDPTDGTGVLPGVSDERTPLPMELLARFNDAVRATAAARDRALVADVHDHCMGHGMTAPPMERWYWEHGPIEPGARGASEIRRVWLDALVEALA